jgi:hypothetical protein
LLFAGPAGAGNGYTCSSGTSTSPTLIPAGSYGSMTVTGFCYMQGSVQINGRLTIAPGAGLDAAVFFGFPPFLYGQPCNVTVSVSGGIQVGQNGVLYLGNSGDTGCQSNSNDIVNGGLRASNADEVVVHGTTINGGFSAQGGGGAASCEPTLRFPFGPYTNIEASTVNGGVSVSGLNTCWIGIILNNVMGNVRINNNETSDTDAIEVGQNTINGGLACAGNFLNPAVPPDPTPNAPNGVPTNFFDLAGPFPNTVTGGETGQCAGL